MGRKIIAVIVLAGALLLFGAASAGLSYAGGCSDECYDHGDCKTEGILYCKTSGCNTCVECTHDSHCDGSCKNYSCVECEYNSDCRRQFPDERPYCDDYVCVECESDSDCNEVILIDEIACADYDCGPQECGPCCNNDCDSDTDSECYYDPFEQYCVQNACVDCRGDEDCDNCEFCDGEESCNATNACEDGDPIDCCDQYCDEDVDGCVECTLNEHCDDGYACNGEEYCGCGRCIDGDPVLCDEGQMCSELEPNKGLCVDCLTDADCEIDGDFCTLDTCNATLGICKPPESPCIEGQVCDEEADGCVECLADEDCEDSDFCNGAETCILDTNTCVYPDADPCLDEVLETVCDEDNDQCVECLQDGDCDDEKWCDGLETCNLSDNTCEENEDPCAADEICNEVGQQCFPTSCIEHEDCDDGLFCNGEETCDAFACAPADDRNPCGELQICIEGDPGSCLDVECMQDAHCPDDGLFCTGSAICDLDTNMCAESGDPCLDDQICVEDDDRCIECEDNDDCADPRPLCSAEQVCVECIVNEDCPDFGAICDENECLPQALSTCGLVVKPKKLKLKSFFNSGQKTFKISGVSGEEGFNPEAAVFFGTYESERTYIQFKKKGTIVKVKLTVPEGTLNPQIPVGPLTVRSGNCEGQIVVK